MISTEELPELLAALYAAPLQPEKWQTFFDHLSRLTNISSGYVMTGTGTHDPQILAGGGSSFNPEVLRLYKEYYGPFDPFGVPLLSNPRVAVIRGEEFVSHEQLVKTEFYNDLLSHYEMESMTMLCGMSSAERWNVMPMWRRSQDGPMDEVSIALLQALLPHARAALQINTRLQKAEIHGQFAEQTMEAISMAAFLVSAAGHVLHMNQSATALVKRADGLRMAGAMLTARNPAESEHLSLLVAGAASANGKRKHTAPGGALNISRQRMQRPLQVTVLPVPESCDAVTPIPCALVLVSDADAVPKSRARSMRMLYGLTPTEARLADLLLECLEVREIADRLGITLETARFHLKRVLTKTGTHRQTELMRLMLSLPGQ